MASRANPIVSSPVRRPARPRRAALGQTLAIAVACLSLSAPADAACKKFGFLVNDYGKEGPANDAKALLDKNIAKVMGDHNIKTFTTGPKSVTCNLFLNFIVFDEYTCSAEATVCWQGAMPADMAAKDVVASAKVQPGKPPSTPAAVTTTTTTEAPKATAKAKPAAKAASAAAAAAPATTTAISTGAVPATTPAVEPILPAPAATTPPKAP